MNVRNRLDIALIGRRLEHNENLGIGYLLASAKDAGLSAQMFPVNIWDDVDAVCEGVLEASPAVVGLALPDGGSSFMMLAVGQRLRDMGCRAHITAGGGFATLARSWLLDRYHWLNSVVRFAGEVTLPLLVQRLTEGSTRDVKVPGLTTRLGDGPPSPVLDDSWLNMVPEHGDLPEAFGYRASHIMATRGCSGRCDYCGPAALQRSEIDEGLRAELSRSSLRQAGVGGIRRRPIDSLCDEMAHLWHERNVRYFYFVDEHLLPHREKQALSFLSDLKRGLRQRDVGPLGIGCMLRADRLSPSVISSFVDVGLVRCFLGIELASQAELRYFRRGGNLERALDTIEIFEKLDVATTCNLMLVHPYSTVGTIERGLSLVERMGQIPFEASQMQVYHGTRLLERLAEEGRLLGNPIRYGYSFEDDRVERFAEILARLRMEAFGDYSLAFHIHDVRLALGIARRIRPEVQMADLRGRCELVTIRSNAIRHDAYAQALGLATQGLGFSGADALIAATRHAVEDLSIEMDALETRLATRMGKPARTFSPMRSAATKVAQFCFAGAALVGCVEGPPPATAHVVDSTDTATDVAFVSPSSTSGDAGTVDQVDENGDFKHDASTKQGCNDQEQRALENRVKTIAKQIDPCHSRTVAFGRQLRTTPPLDAYAWDTSDPATGGQDAAIEARIKSSLTQRELDCLIDQRSAIIVAGQEGAQFNQLKGEVAQRCSPGGTFGPMYVVDIVLDAQGKVATVSQRSPSRQVSKATLQCIEKVLKGLTFPCLAYRRIAPEPVIIE